MQAITTPFYKQLYLDIQRRLKTAAPKIRWTEQDFGQESNPMRPNVLFPAVLIDFPSTTAENISERSQVLTATVTIKILENTYSQSYGAAPDNVKSKALEFFDTEQQVTKALHCWTPTTADGIEYAQPMVRTNINGYFTSADIGLRIRTITFTVEYEEYFDNENTAFILSLNRG